MVFGYRSEVNGIEESGIFTSPRVVRCGHFRSYGGAMLMLSRRRPRAWKGLIAGLAGGLAAAVVMTQFQSAWSKAGKALKAEQDGVGNNESTSQAQEDPTMKAAGKLAALAGYELSQEQKKKAGPIIHYGFGAAMGATYGLMKEFAPTKVRALHPASIGGGYGTALFVGADEVMVPALGLSQPPQKSPLSSHIYGWASHLVYGLTLAFVCNLVRRNL